MTDPTPIPCIMPILAGPEMTEAAIADLLAQSIPVRLLLVNQGVDDVFRDRLERIAEQESDRVLVWSHQPSLPSLSASWNAALDWAWTTGAEQALVVNNDCRFPTRLAEILSLAQQQTGAYFVSAVGVREPEYQADPVVPNFDQRGGPDFSCFLLTRAAHAKYRFDEGFIPAYGEDCDTHRRYMLGGDARRIFSINLPYLHYASGTLKGLPPAGKAELERRIGRSRVYYARKWGPGGINHETFLVPFDPASAREGVTNPELQRAEQQDGGSDDVERRATLDLLT